MNQNIKTKIFGLIALLICGVWTAQAQSVNISPGATNTNAAGDVFYCMDVNNAGTQFQVTGNGLSFGTTSGTIVQYTWTATGGITITAGQGTSTVTVKPKNGTNYSPDQFSKYAKGKLKVTCRVAHSYQYTYIVKDPCNESDPGTVVPATHTYYVNYPTEIEIRKKFDRPDSGNDNAIVGPQCVKTGDRVTYSVAPWVVYMS